MADENGQGMVEYALLIGFIALVVIVALVQFGPRVAQIYANVNDKLTAMTTGG